MGAIREKLEAWGKLTGVPVLALAAFSLIVASLSLVVGYFNYRLQAKPPDLVFTNGTVGDNYTFLRLYWQNDGKWNAWGATAKLYTVDNGSRATKPFAEASIKGAGGKVFAGYGGGAECHIPGGVPSQFLACVMYFDGDGALYERMSLLEQHKKDGGLADIEEQAVPSNVNCR